MDWLYKTSKTVESFLEIGSYKGKSTHAILSGGAKEVYAVDHFVGSSDPIETGNLDTYDAFLKNVGHFSNLTIKRMSSLEAAKEFEDKSLDVVFIDGGHRIQEITEDIVAWLPKTKKILCGHDYNDVKAVKLAVDTLLGPVQSCDRIWWKVLDGSETLDNGKAEKMARYLDIGFVNKMFSLSQEDHPEKKWIMENLRPLEEGNVIYDLGCGRNKTTPLAIGVDIENVTDIQSSIDNLPMVPTGSVDFIISCHSLEHLADTKKTLIELGRILKDSGKIIIVGIFTTYNGTASNNIVRINTNGSIDTTFTIGTGLNAFASCVAIQSDDKILVGGNFTSFNGNASIRLVRLNSNGTYDNTFNVGTGFGTAVDAYVQTIVIQSDGKIVVSGAFTTYNGTTVNRILRLNTDGSIDT
jgi:uncharacterized delta-60 repeat protein